MNDFMDEDERTFKKAFDLFDKDGDGSIDRKEITTVFKELNLKLSEGEIDRIMSHFDEDGDRRISFDEFIIVVSQINDTGESEGWMFEVFETIDQDCDGLLGREELMRAADAYGLGFEERELKVLLEGREEGLNYEEFVELLQHGRDEPGLS